MSDSLSKINKKLKAHYLSSKKFNYDITVAHKIFRYLSFPLSSLFIKFEISPNKITFLGLLFLLFSFILLMMDSKNFIYLGILFYLIYIILDFSDGNVARYLNKSNFFGKLIDGFVDFLSFLIFIPFYYVYRTFNDLDADDDFYLALSITISFLALIYCYLKLRISLFEKESMKKIIKSKDNVEDNSRLQHRFLKLFSQISENILTGIPILFLLFLILNKLDIFLFFYFLYFSIICSTEIIIRMIRIKDKMSSESVEE